MKNLPIFAIGSLALTTILIGSTAATTLTFGNTSSVPANNTDLAADYGSNIAGTPAETAAGFITTDGTGATPNIALTWAPAGGPRLFWRSTSRIYLTTCGIFAAFSKECTASRSPTRAGNFHRATTPKQPSASKFPSKLAGTSLRLRWDSDLR